MGGLLVWLSGADSALLSQHRVDRGRYVGMGSAILTTGTMAGISLWFALHTALGVSALGAVPFALAWAVMIMGLDRWLVVSLKRRQGWKAGRYFLAASPRLAMAVLFGFVISTPLTLQVFHSEIRYQLTLAQQRAVYNYKHGKTRNQLQQQVDNDNAAIVNLTNGVSTGGPAGNPSADKTLQTLKSQLATEQGLETTYYYQWQCQLYGTAPPGGHKCPPGNGKLAAAAGRQYANAVSQVAKDKNLVAQRETALQQQSKKKQAATSKLDAQKLKTAKQQLTTDQNLLKQSDDNFFAANKADTGLLARIRALDQAAAGDSILNVSRLLLFLFFMVIDCLPVLVKIWSNLGEEDEYELAVKSTRSYRLAMSRDKFARMSQKALTQSAAQAKTQAEVAAKEAEADKAHAEAAEQARLYKAQRKMAKAEAEQQIVLDGLQRRVARKTRTRSRARSRLAGGGSYPRFGSPGGATHGTPETFLQEFRAGPAAADQNGQNGHQASSGSGGGIP